MEIFSGAQGQLTLQLGGLIWPNFELLRALMHVIVTCKYEKDRMKKQPRKSGNTVFPMITQWELSVVMETRVLTRSCSKPNSVFSQPK